MLSGTWSPRVREELLSCLRRKGISLYHRIGQQPVRERGTGEVKEGGDQVIRISSSRHLKPGFLSDHDKYLIWNLSWFLPSTQDQDDFWPGINSLVILELGIQHMCCFRSRDNFLEEEAEVSTLKPRTSNRRRLLKRGEEKKKTGEEIFFIMRRWSNATFSN